MTAFICAFYGRTLPKTKRDEDLRGAELPQLRTDASSASDRRGTAGQLPAMQSIAQNVLLLIKYIYLQAGTHSQNWVQRSADS